MDVDERPDDWNNWEPEEPVVQVDRETGERFIVNPAGTKIYLVP